VPVVHAAELGLFAYRRLRGTPLIHRTHRQSEVIEPALIAVLSAFRRLEPVLQLPVDHFANEEWHQEAVGGFTSIRSYLGAEQAELVEAFLDEPTPPTRSTAVAQHNDLGAEHILVGPRGDVTGVIDWTDAARTDPARDLGAIYRDLGRGTAFRVSQALGRPVTDDEARRIRFHARCKWVEDVRFGLLDAAARTVYLTNAQQTFDHTFRPSP
jgi:aminoglycoside phosphotransferase (APT) family kinase protein